MSRQPTATALTRTQESWAQFVLAKVQAKIAEQESWLREQGWKEDEFPNSEILMNLYDDELFYIRYAEEMQRQREYINRKYFGVED